MPRIFGPTQGAGTQVTERDAEQPITPAALGWAGYVGILERGNPGELIFGFSKANALAKTGNYSPDSVLPDAIRHYFNLAGGAGGLVLVRVTDGTELPAERDLYVRRTSRASLGTLQAKNGGRWGGFEDRATGTVAVVATDITETTLDTAVSSWEAEQWSGAYIELAGVANKRYQVIDSDAAGVLTIASDLTMAADLAAGGDATNDRWYLHLEPRSGRGLHFEVSDGTNDAVNEFSLSVKDDGVVVRTYPDLSVDPASKNYWQEIINGDTGNHWVKAVDTWTGARTPDVRPANIYDVAASVTATVLTTTLDEFVVVSPGGGNPTNAMGTITALHQPQVITITMVDATTGNAVSDKFGALGLVTLGTLFDPGAAAGGALENKWVPSFTATAGASPLVITDTLTITFKPIAATNALKDGFLYPDKISNGDKFYRIVSNTHSTITVSPGSDMSTDITGGDDEFMVVAFQKLAKGRDGHAGVTDNEYITAWDKSTSPMLQIKGKNLGLVKFATPGVTSTAVQKAGADYAGSNGQQYRYEVVSGNTDEGGIDTYVNSTLGKSPFGDFVVSAQSYAKVLDPEASGKLKKVSITGMIHGREASMARDYGGYHKAAAGTLATLPSIVELYTGEKLLNEEYLNPRGINVIKKKGGQFVIWGDRNVSSNTGWTFKHSRETMSYYIHVLEENFDFSIFALNDPNQWEVVRSSLISFFWPQYTRRALNNSLSFDEAFKLKIDSENNTLATQAAGDMNAEIEVAIVDTVERLRFGIGKAGITDSEA